MRISASNSLRTAGMLLAATLAGYVGGLLSQSHPQAQAQAPLPPAANVVRARSFQMVDEAGRVRAELSETKEVGVALVIYDAAGQVSAAYCGSTLGLCKPQGGLAVSLLVADDGGAGLTLHGTGMSATRLGTFEGDSTLEYYDTNGKLRSMLGIRGGDTALNQYDAAGELRSTFSVFKNSRNVYSPYLGFSDATGKLRASMTLLADGRPGIGLLNARGDVFWQAPP